MAGSEPSPDLFLARRAAAGHPDAWDQIIDAHGRRLYNLAFQFAGSREEAEDLTQEIFIRLYRSLRTYRGEVPLIGWALRLSRNLCIDHYRKMRRERNWRRVSDTVLEMLPASDDVEDDAQRRQRVAEVYGALAELPEDQAEAVVLCDLQGWSFDEAAAFLDLPLGTLKSRLHRARTRLTEIVRSRIEGPAAGVVGKGTLPC